MNQPGKSFSLAEFLNEARGRLTFRNLVSAAALAICVVSLIVAPLVIYRAKLELPNVLLAIGIVLMIAALFAVLAMRRFVPLGQVPERLHISAEDRERITSAAEFLGDGDPLKHLALAETEQWIAEHHERLGKIKNPRSPFAAVLAILLLIILWLLTPAFHRFSSSHQLALAEMTSKSTSLPQNQDTNSPPKNSLSKSAANSPTMPAQGNSPRPINARATGAGGNRPSQGAGHSPIPNNLLGPLLGNQSAPKGQSPAHRPQQQSNTPLPGGAGRSMGGKPFVKVPTAHLSPEPTVRVNTANARATGTGKERDMMAKPDDMVTRQHAAATKGQLRQTPIDPTELDALPPNRRQLVIEYFRLQNEPSTSSSQGTSQP